MDDLPEEVVRDILGRINRQSDKNSVSLSCKRLYEMDKMQRKYIRVGLGMNPANEALFSLCTRFQNLEKVEISYSGWMSKSGKQLDDRGLYSLSTSCPNITDLTLSYCILVTDDGLAHLASCSHFSALKLISTPRITAFGILSVVVRCRKLTLLHLIRCLNVTSLEWIEYLGELETLEDLCIKNCRGIGEGDLKKLGQTWGKLKRLQFEVDSNYCNMKAYDRSMVLQWQKLWVPCDNMLELYLVNGIITPERGLACVLGKCQNLKKIHLDTCVGVRDSDIIGMAYNSRNLRSISLRFLMNNPIRLTDECLEALAQNCKNLESIGLSFSVGKFPSFSSFTLDGILNLLKNCPVRELALNNVYVFNDVGMQALCRAEYLETLELTWCQDITDEGLQLVGQFPRLRVFKLSKCLRVSDDGLRLLVGSHKLKVLTVDDCPQISERGIQGAADSVSFKQDLSWMH